MKRSMFRLTLPLLVCLSPSANHAVAANTFDGTYTGPMRETLNNNSGYCNIPPTTRIVVQNGLINYKWGVPLDATVAADGSFAVSRQGLAVRGASAAISLKGRITGPNLEADVGGDRCAAHMSLKKS